jgi:hypothetical protein
VTERLDSTRASVWRDVSYLASAPLNGRATGSAGNESAPGLSDAAVPIFADQPRLQVRICDSVGACVFSYQQSFRLLPMTLRLAGIDSNALAFNVAAAIPGTDSVLQHQWIVIGAHYDHLGQTGYGALDHRTATRPHLGADDNASGTAAVLELAARLANSPMRRSVLLVHFGAEELGLFGSKALC